MDDLELGYLLAVAAAGVWSPRALAQWLRVLGTPRAVVEAARVQRDETPSGAEKLSSATRARLAVIDDAAALEALATARASGAHIVPRDDPRYPARLHELCDAPLVLYVRGELASLARRSVAIVGSRAASAYGRAVAAQLATDFSAYGATIVSGLARGVDAAAHKGAIDARLPTVAVLGSGICALYPRYHALLADEIVAGGGAVISEFPPAECARAFHFPMRNRVVAVLADATIVVEASERSGALITARLADELGRHVFAIPGDIGRPTSRGTNALIADGIPLVTSARDAAGLMQWAVDGRLNSTAPSPQGGFPETLDDIIRALPEHGCAIDELAILTGASAADLAARLTLLELQGAVARRAGGLYVAVHARDAPNARACN